jgi:TRAP-type C4-dicarboxylate transport system permease small subunit
MRWSIVQLTIDRIGRFVAIIVGYALLLLSIFVFLEILLRRFLNYSLQGVDEIGGYILAITCAFGFSYALLHRAHTRIDILLARVPPGLQAVLNLLAAAVLAGVASFMAWRAWATYLRTIELGSIAATPLQTPIWVPQTFWVAGLTLFAFTALLMALRGLYLLMRGPLEVNYALGPPTLQQEIEEEMEKAGMRDPRRDPDRSAP